MQGAALPLVALGAALLFQIAVQQRNPEPPNRPDPGAAVVMPAAMQVLLYGGDRYLAADIEAVRAVVSMGGLRSDESGFRARAHLVVSQLNPCHEDNYWIGNAELVWGGGQSAGQVLLRRATNCRFWDPWPPFFLGFSQYFFDRNVTAAREALEVAAQRADEKTAAAFRSFSVSLLAGQFEDAEVALEMVRRERDQTNDERLRKLLSQRAERLEGLVVLRRARKEFELRFRRAPGSAQELVSSGVLARLPEDPAKLGYVLEKGEFQLRQVRHAGLEKLR